MDDSDRDYRPDYGQFEPYQFYGQKPKKKHTGLIVVLATLALLTGAVSWIVNVLGIRVDYGQSGMVLTIGSKNAAVQSSTTQTTLQENPDQVTGETTQTEAAVSDEGAQEETEASDSAENAAVLTVQSSQASAENYASSQEDSLSLQEIYEKVIPSVASISCVQQDGTDTGTGIVMSEDGYIITNYHVIENAQQIYVLLGEDDQYQATLVGGDETTDLAVLKITATGLTAAEFGDSDQLRVGDVVVAIGDPLGTDLRGTMTDGIISAINRNLNLSGRQMTLLQTNAALNSGNSGGPLINCYGQVIGITTMKMSNYSSTSATVEGLGFAIPINSAKPIVDELISQGYVSGRPAIGIEGQTLDLRAQFFYNLPSGVIVTSVVKNSDAAECGITANDVIVAANGVEIRSLEDLVTAKEDLNTGDTINLTVYRNGGYYSVDVELIDQVTADIY